MVMYIRVFIKLWSSIFGNIKMCLASAVDQLGLVNRFLGDYDASLKNHLRALSIAKEAANSPGANAGAVAAIVNAATASVEEMTGAKFPTRDDDVKAIERIRAEVSVTVEKIGEDCERVYDLKRSLCDVLYRCERHGEAAEVMASVVGSATTTLGPDHPMTVQYWHYLSLYQRKAYENDGGYEYD